MCFLEGEGGSPQLGYGYFLEKKKNIWFQNNLIFFFQASPVKLNNGAFMPSIALGSVESLYIYCCLF